MNEPALLFNELFIDFVRSIFFRDPQRQFTSKELFAKMPHFYYDEHMVNSAINILLMRGDLIQHPLTGSDDQYSANPLAVENDKKSKEESVLNKQIDFKIKELTKDSLTWQRWPQKYWYLVLVGGIIIGGAFTKFLESKKESANPSLIRQEIRVGSDNSSSRKNDTLP